MPYSERQKRQHILELQRYLHAIALIDRKIPNVNPDGIYGTQTAEAVKAFQHEYKLSETGKADFATWNKVVEVYKGMLRMKPRPYPAFPSEKFVCEKGAEGKLVYIIQAMLYGIGQGYDNFPKIKVCGHFNEETENAVRIFQKICSLPPNGKVDCVTWNMLVSCSCSGL